MVAAILDQTQDLTGAEWHRLTSLFAVPDFVKLASHEQRLGDTTILPPTVYAYPQQRLYPCHTKAATWASAAFFTEKQANWSADVAAAIWTRIKQAAAYWQIEPLIEQLTAAMTKSAAAILLTDADYALVWGADDVKQRHYPLRNGAEVKAASAWLEKFRDDFTLEDRQQIAAKVLVKAASFNVTPDNNEYLCRTAGFGYCTQQQLAECWTKRANLVRRQQPAYAERATAVAAAVMAAPIDFRDHDTRVKLAVLMDQFDTETRLNKLYGDGLERPEDQIFQITEKVASETAQAYVSTTSGTVYEKAAMADISLDDVRGWLGDDIADAVAIAGCHLDTEKLAAVIGTLPRPDAQVFDRLAASLGIQPFARSKSAAVGFTAAQLQELAAI